MENPEIEFLDSLKNLSTAKDKIFEISNLMIVHQSTSAKPITALWLKEFQSLKDEKRKLAMLFVMNDALIKSIRDTRGDEYLKEFPLIMNDLIQNLIEFKNEFLLEELRKIIMVWEKPGSLLYVSQYTSQLKLNIQDAINAVQDDKTGASVIQEFEITKRLSALEAEHEANLDLAKRVDGITEKGSALKKSELLTQLEEYREKCEAELVERSKILLDLSELLESEYKLYTSYPDRLEEVRSALENP